MSTLEHVAAELAIRNLIADLAWQADHATTENLDDYLVLFTEDAEWEVANTQYADTRKGHEQIREGAAARRETKDSGPGSDVYHVITGSSIKIESATTASSKSYIQSCLVKFGVPSIFMMGEYRDQYLKTTEGWKLKRRTVHFL